MSKQLPLVVIVGSTASGKTALGIELAQQFNGEIICADSRTVYKYMDIGTAKPTVEERRAVVHHMLDLVEPDKSFTVVDFKLQAEQAMADVWNRDKLPIVVGGSGLYIDAVLFDYSFSPDGAQRDSDNPRHAHASNPHTKRPLRENTLILGLSVPRDTLKQNIEARVQKMLENGAIEETRWLYERYAGAKALLATSYKAIMAYTQGLISLEEAKQRFISNDYQLARRQQTWLKPNKSIQWVSDSGNAVELVTTFLNKKQ